MREIEDKATLKRGGERGRKVKEHFTINEAREKWERPTSLWRAPTVSVFKSPVKYRA